VAERKRKGEEGPLGWRAALVGRAGTRSAAASVRERREASGLLGLRAEKKGWAANRRKGGPRREERLVGLKEREGEEGRFCEFSFFFKLVFKLHSNNKTMHSNYDAQALIVSSIIEMIFKYFKG
jgi:hypothetical protein